LCHVYLYAHNASPACTLGLCHITITLAGPRAKALASCSRPAAQRVRCACGRSSNADGWPNADGWLHACSPSPLSLGTANVPTVRLTSTASTHASPSCGPCSSILPNAAPHTRDAPLPTPPSLHPTVPFGYSPSWLHLPLRSTPHATKHWWPSHHQSITSEHHLPSCRSTAASDLRARVSVSSFSSSSSPPSPLCAHVNFLLARSTVYF